ncbi:aminotransferase class V-fold PLP-dependent enzyme [Candidatus Carsonella ruddii]|uniref:Cysteine desulfurase SufS n=1 Tax=Candidatus Carsonella ruddii (Diaphorina cf. continua) TaxID=2661587 RepID=A0A7R6VZ79_CARRU|nr:aminotransferase class V-fold PLP-dependent enzyme [Candidatus Carsonella ruddii (Diaphorina cf. continua)]BCG49256.1 cysteine desulfurase SufS [Candidatus Carsonella ruddii (Diaphorina cf. continua)]
MFLFLKRFKKYIYFDSSSTNQKPKILFKSVINTIQKKNFNLNRGEYDLLNKNDIIFRKLKFLLKKLLKINFIEEIFFFYNSTFSVNFIIINLINFLKKTNEVIISKTEHNSVLIPLLKIIKNKKIIIIICPIIKLLIFKNIFCNYINNNTMIFATSHISNNYGIITRIKNLLNICKYNNILSIVDSTQSISYINTNLKKINSNFLFFSFHKLYSLTGVSVLYCNINFINKLKPHYLGGGTSTLESYTFKLKKLDEKFYFGTQNIFSLFSSYYSIKWFLKNKKYIFYTNYFLKKILFYFLKKRNKNCKNTILIYCKNGFFFNYYLNLNKIILRCDKLCNYMKNMFINKKNNCRLSLNFFNKIKEIFKIKFLIHFFNFKIRNY